MKLPTLSLVAAMSLIACGKGAHPTAPDPAAAPPSFAESLGDWTSETGTRLKLGERATDTGSFMADYHDATTDDPRGTWTTDQATHRQLDVIMASGKHVCGRWVDRTTLRLTRVMASASERCPDEQSAYEYTLTKRPTDAGR